uniref:Uncharacterized protein n=1 Tax=Desertifilum tharense IPPAS B-1220 TaxID=1781255 RepID=A0ACD5H0C0_9CYAN
MTDLCVIVGMGEGNGMAIARRFAQEGFAIAMLARNEQKLKGYQATLQAEGITSHYFLPMLERKPPSRQPSPAFKINGERQKSSSTMLLCLGWKISYKQPMTPL